MTEYHGDHVFREFNGNLENRRSNGGNQEKQKFIANCEDELALGQIERLEFLQKIADYKNENDEAGKYFEFLKFISIVCIFEIVKYIYTHSYKYSPTFQFFFR